MGNQVSVCGIPLSELKSKISKEKVTSNYHEHDEMTKDVHDQSCLSEAEETEDTVYISFRSVMNRSRERDSVIDLTIKKQNPDRKSDSSCSIIRQSSTSGISSDQGQFSSDYSDANSANCSRNSKEFQNTISSSALGEDDHEDIDDEAYDELPPRRNLPEDQEEEQDYDIPKCCQDRLQTSEDQTEDGEDEEEGIYDLPRDSRDNLADNPEDEDEDYDLPRPSGKSFIAEESSEDEYDLPRPSSQSLLDDDDTYDIPKSYKQRWHQS